MKENNIVTIVPNRLGVKFSLKRQPTLKPEDILPIFQRWIQEHRLEGMLIDVIDYKHVPEGPGILLIADEADIAYDLADGEIGLHYIRKRDLPGDLSQALQLTFRSALAAARALEEEAPGDIVFDFGSAKISFFDRMNYRNTADVFAKARPIMTKLLGEIYGREIAVSRFYDDSRALFALRCTVAGESEIDVKALGARLERKQATV